MAVLDNAELSKVQYSDYSELLIENQIKSKQSYQLNQTFNKIRQAVFIIDLEVKTNYLLQMLSKVLESMQNVSVLFNNMGSPDVCVLNKTIVRKLIDLKNTHAYSKGMMINI